MRKLSNSFKMQYSSLSDERKLEISQALVSSDTFKNAPTSIALLQYLVQANIEHRALKESIIEIEFFGGKAGSEKSTPRVRVNIYNLRKKLAQYYENEGAHDTWHITVTKGQYELRFTKQQTTKKRLLAFPKQHLMAYIILGVLVLVLGFSHLGPKPPAIWKDILKNKHTTNLFIGDAYGYSGLTISGNRGWTRDFNINSVDEYYAMLESKPELKDKTNPTDYFYSTRMAENATHDLARFFTQHSKDFEIKYATNTPFKDIKKGNTIYVGRLKNQENFIYLFNEGNPYCTVWERELQIKGHPSIPDTSILVGSYETEADYAVVSRIPGPEGTEQFLFFSDHDIGVMGAVEYFTNKKSLKEFSKTYLKDNEYFTAVFIAKGKERINLKLETVLVVGF